MKGVVASHVCPSSVERQRPELAWAKTAPLGRWARLLTDVGNVLPSAVASGAMPSHVGAHVSPPSVERKTPAVKAASAVPDGSTSTLAIRPPTGPGSASKDWARDESGASAMRQSRNTRMTVRDGGPPITPIPPLLAIPPAGDIHRLRLF